MEVSRTSPPHRPIQVALRGAGGLLGHRLLRTILGKSNPEIEVTTVILGTDEPSFRRLQSACRALPSLPDLNVYVDERRRKLGDLMRRWGSPWELKPLDQAWGDLEKTDAIVDTAIVRGNDAMQDFLSRYSKTRPVIHQSGVYPAHQLIAGPFDPAQSQENLNYRQGDCLLSGMAPILFPFAQRIARINIHLLVQRQTRLNDYTLRDNLDDIIVNPAVKNRIKDEVSHLLPNLDRNEVSLSAFEVPGHDDYLCEFDMELTEPTTREEVIETLRRQPRVFMAPPEIPISTGQVRQRLREPYLENGIPLQPIVCFECDEGIEVRGRRLLLHAAFYSKAITMLPNIDAIRGLVRGMAMRKAMEETDRQMGFKGPFKN